MENKEIKLEKLICLLLGTNRFNRAKCVIWDNSKTLYAGKVGCVRGYITSGKLAEISNLEYLYNRNVEELHIKGFFKNQIEIVVSCEEME